MVTLTVAWWCLVAALLVEVFLNRRVLAVLPGKATKTIATEAVPRVSGVLLLAGVGTLCAAWFGAWLNHWTTAIANFLTGHWHLPVVGQAIVAAIGVVAALSALTWIIAGDSPNAKFLLTAVFALSLLSAIPGPIGDFVRSTLHWLGDLVTLPIRSLFGIKG